MKLELELDFSTQSANAPITVIRSFTRREVQHVPSAILCKMSLKSLFDIPENARRVFLTITDAKPSGENWYDAKFTDAGVILIWYEHTWNNYTPSLRTQELLTHLGIRGRTLYIWLSYA